MYPFLKTALTWCRHCTSRPVIRNLKWIAVILLAVVVWRTAASSWVKDWVIGPQHHDIEIFDSSFRGYNHNTLSWLIRAKKIWTQGNKTAFKLEGLFGGQLFDENGNVVIQNIRADSGDVNIRSKIMVMTHVSADLGFRSVTPKHGLIAAESRPRSVKIEADELRYYGTSKRTFLSGSVSIIQGRHRIVPKNGVEVDNAENIAYIKDGFTIYVDQMVITGNTMTIYIDEEYSMVPDGIHGYRPVSPTDDPELDSRENALRRLPTHFSAGTMRFSSKNGEDLVELTGSVIITQPDKSAESERLIYDRTSDVLTFENNVVLKSNQLRWALLRKKPIKNEDIRKAVNQPIKILGNKAVFEGGPKRGRILGNVQVYQEGQKSFSQKLEFEDSDGLIHLIGAVSFEKENKDILRCNELIIDINKEEMVAKKSITTEFKLRSKGVDANR